MTAASLAIIVFLGQAPVADPSGLVAQLGSRHYAEREAAAQSLEHLGYEALPALRLARSSRDLEIRTRATYLVNRIEGALLTQPTLIALDFQDRPLPEVLKAIGEQAGVQLTVTNEAVPPLSTRRLTLREPRPVTLWKAIDRLCDAGQLYYNPLRVQTSPVPREPQILLSPVNPSATSSATPTSDSGPFRLSLLNLHFQRDVLFDQGGFIRTNPRLPEPVRVIAPQPNPGVAAGPTVNEEFSAQIQITAEPRLAIFQNGPLRILEAIDEHGQSLLHPIHDGPFIQRASGYFGITSGSTLTLQALLSRPTQPSRTIKRLRGSLSVMVSTRKPNPLIVSLNNPLGKTFQNDDATLSILDIRIDPNTRQTTFDLSIRSNSAGFTSPAATVAPADFPFPRPDVNQQQIEILDAQGRLLPWYGAGTDGEGTRFSVTLIPRPDQSAPVEIRHYTLSRAATDVSFVFEDVPMP
jgi:hypothetical protein